MTSACLEVKDLVKHYPVRGQGTVKAVNGVNFTLESGQTLGLVGESGSGKSTIGKCLVRLEDVTSGQIVYDGVNLASLSRNKLWEYRRSIQMVFQDPFDSLNPRMSAGRLVSEPLHLFKVGSDSERRDRVVELFRQVGLGEEHLRRYAHQLSGGQQQRVGIARALATSPSLIVLDEPTTALDVSVQATILNLLKRLQVELGLTYLLISHDLAVVSFLAQRVAVLYLGEIVEEGMTDTLLSEPLHPYTLALITALPGEAELTKERQVVLSGEIPSAMNIPEGCSLSTRCPFADTKCHQVKPVLREVNKGHRVACHYAESIAKGAS